MSSAGAGAGAGGGAGAGADAADVGLVYRLEASTLSDDGSFDPWFNGMLRCVQSAKGFGEPRVLHQPILDTGKPTVVFVLGGPGAGKGTQCQKIKDVFGWEHISAGDCLRAERASGSKDADLINNYIKQGQIVPVEITIKLLMKAMETSGNSKFLIDGFPRNLDNLLGWNKIVGQSVNVAFVLFFDCPEKVMEARLLERGQTSGRADDNIESIKKRFRTYQDSTMPIIRHFEAQGKVRYINSDATVEEVFGNVCHAIDSIEDTHKPSFRSVSAEFDVSSRADLDKFRRDVEPDLNASAVGRWGDKVILNSRMLHRPHSASAASAAEAASSGCRDAKCCILSTLKKPSFLGALLIGGILGWAASDRFCNRHSR